MPKCIETIGRREIIYHSANEGKNNARLTSIGLYSGCSDLIFTWKGKHYYCEVKTLRGRLSASQEKFAKHIAQTGSTYFVCRSLEEFKNEIQNIDINA